MAKKMNKKILLVTPDFPPMIGGIANYLANLCTYLPKESLTVFAPRLEHDIDFDSREPYPIARFHYPLDCHPFHKLLPALRLLSKIRKQLSQNPSTLLAFWDAISLAGI